ncbi:hypothetical protein Q3G72_006626 [Acer saccharum]|nr:hypothetical protein Q3G72_006626 [Acer saccharum]
MLTSETGALFSSFTVESVSLWIGTEIFTCYLGLSDFDLSMTSDCAATVIVDHRKVFVKMQSRADLRGADVKSSFGKMRLMLRE